MVAAQIAQVVADVLPTGKLATVTTSVGPPRSPNTVQVAKTSTQRSRSDSTSGWLLPRELSAD